MIERDKPGRGTRGIEIKGVFRSVEPPGCITIVRGFGKGGNNLVKGIFLPYALGARINGDQLVVPNPASTMERPLLPRRFSLSVILNGGGEGGEILTTLKSFGIRVLPMGQIRRGNW